MRQFSRKTLSLVGYLSAFLAFFVIFFYSTFPEEPLKKRLILEIERNTKYNARVDKVKLYPVLGFKFSGIELFKDKATSINIDSLKLSPSVFSLFFDKTKIPFQADISEADIKGNFEYSKSSKTLEALRVDLDKIDAKLISSFIKSGSGIPNFDGNLSGKLDISFKKGGSKNVPVGSYSFLSKDLSISNLKFEKFKLPSFEKLHFRLAGEIDPLITKIENLEFKNGDFDLKLSGSMPLPWNLKRGGKLDLDYKLLVFSTDAKFGILKAIAKAQKDGSYMGQILGTVSKPKFVSTKKVKF